MCQLRRDTDLYRLQSEWIVLRRRAVLSPILHLASTVAVVSFHTIEIFNQTAHLN